MVQLKVIQLILLIWGSLSLGAFIGIGLIAILAQGARNDPNSN